jgi:tRNA delta(2)-isopentenylpyrophosphate transferase
MSSELIVIVGPTASGKTQLAIDVAKRIGGEIICADSRTVYRELDIGTAKPTAENLSTIPHYGINLVDPDQKYSLYDFIAEAKSKVEYIKQRGKIPILVGGSGLYVDGVLFNYQLNSEVDTEKRAELESLSVEQLIDYCKNNYIQLPDNFLNKRYLIRTIEQRGVNNRSDRTIQENIIVVGISTPREDLNRRIERRVRDMFDEGVIEEAKKVASKYGWQLEAMKGNVYQAINQYCRGDIDLASAIHQAIVHDHQLVKKQMTWFRRDPFIVWGQSDELLEYISYRNSRL